jgi:polyisoprenoid-binding protein YceI
MSRMSKKLKFLLAGLALVVVAVGVGVFLFFRDDAPPEVSSDDARATAEAAQEDAEADDDAEATEDTSGAEAPDGIEGTWAVDTTIGTFDFSDSASATFVGFRIEEELTSVGSTTAVGRTPAVTGEITIEGTELTEATFEADMTQITTDRAQRNSRVQGALGTGEFPTATFVLSEPVDLGEAATTGSVTVTATGELTIHGITQTVEIPLTAELVGEIITVTGQLDIVFADYDVQVPSAPVVVSASDEGVVEILLFLTRP